MGDASLIRRFGRPLTRCFPRKNWRRRPDLNRGWRFCRPLPYLLATAPLKSAPAFAHAGSCTSSEGVTAGRQPSPGRLACQPKLTGAGESPPPLLRSYGGQPSPAFVSEGWSGKRDSNPRLRPWQGRTLPLSYSRSPESLNYHEGAVRLKPDAIVDNTGRVERASRAEAQQTRTLHTDGAQHLRCLFRRRRVDVEAAPPFEPGHARDARHHFHVPVEERRRVFRQRRAMDDQVERRLLERAIHTDDHRLEHPRQALEDLTGRLLIARR